MSESRTPGAPVGIRTVTVDGAGRLVWVAPGSFELKPGDRVAAQTDDREFLGEVVVPARQLREWPALTGLPVVVRRLDDAERPPAPARAGRQLLEALGLPADLLAPSI